MEIDEQIYEAMRRFHRDHGRPPKTIYLGRKQKHELFELGADMYSNLTQRDPNGFYVVGMRCFDVIEQDHLAVTY